MVGKVRWDYRLDLLQVNGFSGQLARANATADPLLSALVEELHTYIVARQMRPIIVTRSLGGLFELMLAKNYLRDVTRLVTVHASHSWELMSGPNVRADSLRPMAHSMRDGVFL